jgi:hypothetical protein
MLGKENQKCSGAQRRSLHFIIIGILLRATVLLVDFGKRLAIAGRTTIDKGM